MCTGRGSNQGPLGPKSDALTTAPLRHLSGVGGGWREEGGQGGCERRIEVFVKIKKKWGAGGVGSGGGRVGGSEWM